MCTIKDIFQSARVWIKQCRSNNLAGRNRFYKATANGWFARWNGRCPIPLPTIQISNTVTLSINDIDADDDDSYYDFVEYDGKFGDINLERGSDDHVETPPVVPSMFENIE